VNANPATIWAHTFVDELARAGVRAAVIAPGSRSTPLTLAFAAHPQFRVYSLLDERGAAFFALGLAQASGMPAALLCTSGTAAANFFPAIIEASEAHVPLLVLTADRPPELRGTGANQTMDQVKLYGGYVRDFREVPLPEIDPAPKMLRALRTLADRAVAAAMGVIPGPVHLNFPFRKPLEPAGDPVPFDLAARPDGLPFTSIAPFPLFSSAPHLDFPSRGLILCGPRCPAGDFPAAIADLAAKTGYPIIADALSGVRFGPWAARVLILNPQTSEVFKASEVPTPDLILQFGAVPASQAVLSFLENLPLETRRISVQAHGTWHDDVHTLSELIYADPAAFCRDLGERAPEGVADPEWIAALREFEERYWRAVDQVTGAGFFEGLALADVVESIPDGGILFVANSNPVRHLDEFVRPMAKRVAVFCNRGVSGIDGTISTALGVAAASDQPLVLVIGDVAFYHDLNGLLAVRRCGVRATIVLIHNDGGGIFRRLPVAEHEPEFTDLFLTPHGLDFEPAVRMFGAAFVRTAGGAELRAALANAIGHDIPHVIEVRTDSAAHEAVRMKIKTLIAKDAKTK